MAKTTVLPYCSQYLLPPPSPVLNQTPPPFPQKPVYDTMPFLMESNVDKQYLHSSNRAGQRGQSLWL